MTLENLFFLSQSIAAVAIVVSLVFVGMEVRHSNRESRYRTIEEAIQNYRASRIPVIENADVVHAWINGLHDFPSLEAVDKVRFLLMADGFFQNVQGFFLHHADGVMPRAIYRPLRTVLDDFLGYPGLRRAWELRKQYFHADFRASVEERIAAIPRVGSVPSLYGEVPQSHDPSGSPA
jgi:hypothetical protein